MTEQVLISITRDELKEIISETLEEHNQQQPSTVQNLSPHNKKYLSRKELCEKLKISLPTLWKMMRNGSVPYIRVGDGRRILFDEEKVMISLRKY